MKKIILSALGYFLFSNTVLAQNCLREILNDSLNTSSTWITQSSDKSIEIKDGKINYTSAYSGTVNRTYKKLDSPIGKYFELSGDLQLDLNKIQSNEGAGLVLFALTNGNQDFMQDSSAFMYTESNQDALALVVYSSDPADGNIKNWTFLIEDKSGTKRTYDINKQIKLDPTAHNYYFNFKRLNNTVYLNIYLDKNKTIELNGSPVIYDINPKITDLTYFQTGVYAHGTSSRSVTGSLDNLKICTIPEETPCDHQVFYDDYSNQSLWSIVGNGKVKVSGSKVIYDNAVNSTENRIYRSLAEPMKNLNWKLTTSFKLNDTISKNGVGGLIFALTKGNLDFMSYDQNQNYIETFQDGLALGLFSSGNSINGIEDLFFLIEEKVGDSRFFDVNQKINLSKNIVEYFIKFEHYNGNKIKLSVFSDANYTNQVEGSPLIYQRKYGNNTFTHIQHGSCTPGTSLRSINAEVDNTQICGLGSVLSTDSQIINENKNSLSIYPNPVNSVLTVLDVPLKAQINILNLVGQKFNQTIISDGNKSVIDVSNLSPGVYLIQVVEENELKTEKFIKY